VTIPPPPPGTEPGGAAFPGNAQYGSQQYGSQHYGQQPGSAGLQPCAFHPDRATGLHCTRCGRPACPECLTQASVGFHCRACVAESRVSQRTARTVTGAPVGEQSLVTYVLIGVNLLFFLITAIQAHSGVDLGPSRLYQNGALAPIQVASGQWWRLFSSGFLHGSVVHVGVNMLSLYFLGVGLERILGRVRFLAVYLVSLLGGSVSVMLFTDPLSSTIGASGAIFGLMGGLVVVYKRYRADMRQLLIVLVINLYVSFQFSGISWQAHIGGLVVGAVVTAAMVYPPQAVRKKIQIGAAAAAVVVLVAVVAVKNSTIQERCDDPNAVQYIEC